MSLINKQILVIPRLLVAQRVNQSSFGPRSTDELERLKPPKNFDRKFGCFELLVVWLINCLL